MIDLEAIERAWKYSDRDYTAQALHLIALVRSADRLTAHLSVSYESVPSQMSPTRYLVDDYAALRRRGPEEGK